MYNKEQQQRVTSVAPPSSWRAYVKALREDLGKVQRTKNTLSLDCVMWRHWNPAPMLKGIKIIRNCKTLQLAAWRVFYLPCLFVAQQLRHLAVGRASRREPFPERQQRSSFCPVRIVPCTVVYIEKEEEGMSRVQRETPRKMHCHLYYLDSLERREGV